MKGLLTKTMHLKKKNSEAVSSILQKRNAVLVRGGESGDTKRGQRGEYDGEEIRVRKSKVGAL